MKKHAWIYLVAVALLGLFFVQAMGNLSAQSPVVDEPSHIARAMAYWCASDLRLQLGHPPLIHALAGLPLLLEPGVPQLTNLPGWQPLNREELVRHALWDEGRPTDHIVFLARWPVLMLALLLGALIFRWAGERFGAQAAVMALFLFAFDPNLLAHSVVTTTDIGVTFFILFAVYSFDRWARRPSCKWLVISGLAFGLAMTAKFSAAVLLPALLALAIIAGWRARRMKQTLVALLAIFALGAIVVWATYRFEVGPWKPLSINIPAPTFWNGLLRVKEREEEGRVAFLLGQISPRGWWYYFPVAFAVKTPLPTLILLGVAIAGWIVSVYRLGKQGDSEELGGKVWSALVLMLLPVLYFGISMQASLNIGYRHLLPIIPFLFIWISALRLPVSDFRPPTFLRHVVTLPAGACLLVFAWYALGAAAVFPYHLAYFNEIAGGPDNGYKILADSNLDWGQDIKRLKAWLDARGISEAHLAVFTGSRPERYGIQVRQLPGPYSPPDAFGFRRFAPAPGVYVISASNWQGLRLDNPDTYDWFRRQQPVERIGHSLFVYDVRETSVMEKWVAVCYAPDGPIDGDGLAAGLGRADMRSIFFDCRDGWVYVREGGPGYYVIPARGDPTMAETMLLGRATPIYHDRGDPTLPKDNPGFTLYRWEGEAELRAKLAALEKPPGGAFEFEPATLLGYELPRALVAGSMVRLSTWWRANRPGEGNLAQYAHVMSGDRLAANGERIGVQQPQMWQPGDVIVQQFLLKLPQQPGEYSLHVGLYLAPDGPRLPLLLNGQSGDEHPKLLTLQVSRPSLQ